VSAGSSEDGKDIVTFNVTVPDDMPLAIGGPSETIKLEPVESTAAPAAGPNDRVPYVPVPASTLQPPVYPAAPAAPPIVGVQDSDPFLEEIKPPVLQPSTPTVPAATNPVVDVVSSLYPGTEPAPLPA
jgi:hypothetical protein